MDVVWKDSLGRMLRPVWWLLVTAAPIWLILTPLVAAADRFYPWHSAVDLLADSYPGQPRLCIGMGDGFSSANGKSEKSYERTFLLFDGFRLPILEVSVVQTERDGKKTIRAVSTDWDFVADGILLLLAAVVTWKFSIPTIRTLRK